MKLSICCITYNHAKFIRQALDGFLMQKTNFSFEVIVHDDASTDGTADIIREYAKKYPDIIKPVLQTENQWGKGKDILKNFVFPLVRGEYVAMCEGDDYWTDEYKLQKQVEFLDAHPEYSLCFHLVSCVWEDGEKAGDVDIFPDISVYKTNTFEIKDCFHNFMQTNSVVYRWCLKDKLNLIPDGILPGDHYLHLLHLLHGKAYLMPDVMGVYRKHSGGVWFNHDDSFWVRNCHALLKFCFCAERQFPFDYTEKKKEFMQRFIMAGLRLRDWNFIRSLDETYPNLFRDSFVNAKIYDAKTLDDCSILKVMVDKFDKQSHKFKRKSNRFLFLVLLELIVIVCLIIL